MLPKYKKTQTGHCHQLYVVAVWYFPICVFLFPFRVLMGQYLVGHWDKTRSHTDRQTSPWRKQETLSSHFSLPGPRRDMKGVHFWCNFPSKG